MTIFCIRVTIIFVTTAGVKRQLLSFFFSRLPSSDFIVLIGLMEENVLNSFHIFNTMKRICGKLVSAKKDPHDGITAWYLFRTSLSVGLYIYIYIFASIFV